MRSIPTRCLLILAGLMTGCGQAIEDLKPAETPRYNIISPARAPLYWTVQQPGYVEAFEETAVLAKISGYVQKWHVDIGDRVKKGEVLAELWVPEYVEDVRQKKGAVTQADAAIVQAQEALGSAEAKLEQADANLRLAEAGRIRADAGMVRWEKQYGREKTLFDRGASAVQDLDITTEQRRTAEAAQAENVAAVASAKAALASAKAERARARADIKLAQARREVAGADLDHSRAILGYARITAPFDGVITRRKINTGDFVQPPVTGQPEPLFVVQRRDIMRVFVEVPERDAVWLDKDATAEIQFQALGGKRIAGNITRMSYGLKRQARTLLAEIDLPNPDDLLRPGMYAFAEIHVQRSDVLTVPADAIVSEGDVNEGYRHYCFQADNGKARRLPIKIGARGEGQVEVLSKEVNHTWTQFAGTESILTGQLHGLFDGQPVEVGASR